MNISEIKPGNIYPAALSALLGAGDTHQLLDVRTPAEYASAHVPGAKLIPLNELKVEALLAEHEPGRPFMSSARRAQGRAKLSSSSSVPDVATASRSRALVLARMPWNREQASCSHCCTSE